MEKHRKLIHDSAISHVTGESVYINDLHPAAEVLDGYVVYSPYAHALIKNFNIDIAKKIKGVRAILSYKDIPGQNQLGPVVHDEPCLAHNEVFCIGQAVFLIAADCIEIAKEAAKQILIEYEELPAIVTLKEAMSDEKNLIASVRKIVSGSVEEGFKKSAHILKGELETGGQEHWYLETQSAICVPGEGEEMFIHASSQNPSETQAIVAEVLGISKNQVVCEVKRMGGAFGGKETQGNHVAAWAALLSYHTRKAVKIHLFRDDDQLMTGKRHRFFSRYEVGFNENGKINAYKIELNADAGMATDLTMAILERAMLHADNSYYIHDIEIIGKAWRTNLPSNTAYRGFGGPQGIAVIENAIDRIARYLKKDSFEIRVLNFYKEDTSNYTPYGQKVEHIRLPSLTERILDKSDYNNRRKLIVEFNGNNEWKKRGLALTPVKFGISFTTSFLNQAGALVNIYTDGTVLINHGGTEMGQGLHTKMAGIAAAEFGIDVENIKVSPTNTSKVPNASATAASSGSDINGMAVKNAIDSIKQRLSLFFIKLMQENGTSNITPDNIVFENNLVYDCSKPETSIPFRELISKAYVGQVSLSSTGFYKTPDIHFDRVTGKGKPFHYFSYGVAVSEIELDVLTGEYEVLRSDLIHDVGESLNPSIDKGQVEGAFIQGLGWVTFEEMKYSVKGNLLNHSPDTYKIPTINDIPSEFNVELLENVPNFNTIRRSKAVGEPPFMLAFSVWIAIKDAISSVAEHQVEPNFSLPATPELVLTSIEMLKKNK